MTQAGTDNIAIVGLEDPAAIILEAVAEVIEADHSTAKRLARAFADAPDIRDFSNHLMGPGRA